MNRNLRIGAIAAAFVSGAGWAGDDFVGFSAGDRFAGLSAGDSFAGLSAGHGFAGFSAPMLAYSGDGPHHIAVGDMDGDGVPDLVAPSHWSDRVSVLLGNGDGTFGSPSEVETVNGPQSVGLGDFDHDGDLDVAVVGEYSDNTVSVWFNDGRGRLRDEVRLPVGRGPTCVAVADMNGDPYPDIVVANRDDQTVSVILVNGDESFEAQDVYPSYGAPSDMKLVDLDGDGRRDVVIAAWGGNRVVVLRNMVNSVLDQPVLYATGQYPFGLDVADFNGDGIPDVVTANFGDGNPSTSTVLLGNGDGTLSLAGHVPTNATHQEDVVAGDFNRDGHNDFVVIDGFRYEISVLLGHGDGMFTHWGRQPSGSFPRAIEAADLDGDGDADLVTALLASDWLGVLENLSSACYGDFDGDGETTTLDVLAFLNAWSAGEDEADFDGNGVIGSLDVLRFLNAWSDVCE